MAEFYRALPRLPRAFFPFTCSGCFVRCFSLRCAGCMRWGWAGLAGLSAAPRVPAALHGPTPSRRAWLAQDRPAITARWAHGRRTASAVAGPRRCLAGNGGGPVPVEPRMREAGACCFSRRTWLLRASRAAGAALCGRTAGHGAVPAGAQGLAWPGWWRFAETPGPADRVPTTLAGVRADIRALRPAQAVGCCPTRCRRDGQGVVGAVLRPARLHHDAGRPAGPPDGARVCCSCWGERLRAGRGFRLGLRRTAAGGGAGHSRSGHPDQRRPWTV